MGSIDESNQRTKISRYCTFNIHQGCVVLDSETFLACYLGLRPANLRCGEWRGGHKYPAAAKQIEL